MKPTTVFLVCFVGIAGSVIRQILSAKKFLSMVPSIVLNHYTGSVGAFNLPIDADGNGKVDFVEFKAIMGMLFATDISEAVAIGI